MVARTRQRRTLILGIAVALLPLAALSALGACSSSDANDGEAKPPHPACPASLEEAVGAKCATEGLECPIGYACPPFLPEQAHCTCTGGSFVCKDSRETLLADGVIPACVSRTQGGNGLCPPDELTAQGAPCKVTGTQCAYAGPTCPGETVPTTDICTCEATGGGLDAAPQFHFQCESRGCNPQSDGGVTPAPRDARADAPEGG